jgi:hypothetical protein
VVTKINPEKIFAARNPGPLIRCECGAEILLVPDLKMMVRAIEAHATEHRERERDPVKGAFEETRIEAILNAQALDAAASS